MNRVETVVTTRPRLPDPACLTLDRLKIREGIILFQVRAVSDMGVCCMNDFEGDDLPGWSGPSAAYAIVHAPCVGVDTVDTA